VKHRKKIAELEAIAAEMEQEIKQAEEEQLAYLARSAANTLSGGMDEVFELLRGLRAKPNQGVTAVAPTTPETPSVSDLSDTPDMQDTSNNPNPQNSDEIKEGEAFDETGETEETTV